MSDKTGKPDAWLEGESSVSRAYGELRQTRPPAHLDERILAEARRVAASEDTTVVRVHRWRKWAMPAALAATVVFAVPLVVRVWETSSDFQTAPTAVTETMMTDAVPAATGAADAAAFDGIAPQDRIEDDAPVPERQLARRQTAVPDLASEIIAAPPVDTVGRTESEEFAAAPMTTAEERRLASMSQTVMAESEDLRDDQSQLPATKPGSRDDDEIKTEPLVAAAMSSEEQRGEERATESAVTAELRGKEPVGAALADAPAADDMASQEMMIATSNRMKRMTEADIWLIEIARIHESGRLRTARRELGRFLTDYPDYEIPEFYPLQAGDAIYPDGIVPQAERWLRDIAALVKNNELDAARMQFAEFLKLYPDYPLPEDFPLTRSDAVIER